MIVHILLFGLGRHGHRLWHLLLFLPHILEGLSSCMQSACYIEQRAPHLIIASQVLPSELEPSVALQRAHSCLDESDKIGSQIRNSRGLDIADVVGVVVDGSRAVRSLYVEGPSKAASAHSDPAASIQLHVARSSVPLLLRQWLSSWASSVVRNRTEVAATPSLDTGHRTRTKKQFLSLNRSRMMQYHQNLGTSENPVQTREKVTSRRRRQ